MSKPYYVPHESEDDINLERFFLAGDFVSGVGYGQYIFHCYPSESRFLIDSSQSQVSSSSYGRRAPCTSSSNDGKDGIPLSSSVTFHYCWSFRPSTLSPKLERFNCCMSKTGITQAARGSTSWLPRVNPLMSSSSCLSLLASSCAIPSW